MAKRPKASPGRPATFETPRETILKVAAKLFAARGFEATTLQNVAVEIGITKAALYHYYPTKQAMYDAIVAHLLEQLQVWVRRQVDSAAPYEVQLKQLMISHAEFFEENYTAFVTLLHGVAGLNRQFSPAEAAIRDRYEGFVRDLVAAGSTDGSFVTTQAEDTTRAILSLLNWMSRWYRPDGSRRAREFAEIYFNLIWNGLRPR